MRNEIRARFKGISGLLGHWAPIIVGLVAAKLLKLMGFPQGFAVCFGAGAALYLLAAFIVRRVKEMSELRSAGRRGSSPSPLAALREVWHLRQFRLLLAPFILRGLGDMALIFIMVVGQERLNLPEEYGGYAASAQGVGALLAYGTIGVVLDRFGPGLMLLGGTVLLACSLVGMVLTKSRVVFIVLCTFGNWGRMIEASGVPLSCYYIVPREMMGAWSGARLTLLWISSGISQPLGGHLMDTLGAMPIFFAAALIKLITGILYWYGFGKAYKQLADGQE